MAENEQKPSVLKPFCVEDNLVRTNYYSETFRADFMFKNVRRDWDITRICIPFPAEKERALKERFHLTNEQLPDFYSKFAQCLKHDLQMLKVLNEKGASQTFDDEQKRRSSLGFCIAKVYGIESTKEEIDGRNTSTVYCLTEAMDSITTSSFFDGRAISLLNLVLLGARFAQILKVISEANAHIGAIDLDSVYMTIREGRPMVTLGSFLYGGFDDITDTYPMPPATLPASAPDSIREGGRPSLGTDAYSLAALLWTMTSGDYYTDIPNFNITPQYAPTELVELLRSSMTEDDTASKALLKGLYDIAKKIKRGEIEDKPVRLSAPDYNRKTKRDLQVVIKDASTAAGITLPQTLPDDTPNEQAPSAPQPPVTEAEQPAANLEKTSAAEMTATENVPKAPTETKQAIPVAEKAVSQTEPPVRESTAPQSAQAKDEPVQKPEPSSEREPAVEPEVPRTETNAEVELLPKQQVAPVREVHGRQRRKTGLFVAAIVLLLASVAFLYVYVYHNMNKGNNDNGVAIEKIVSPTPSSETSQTSAGETSEVPVESTVTSDESTNSPAESTPPKPTTTTETSTRPTPQQSTTAPTAAATVTPIPTATPAPVVVVTPTPTKTPAANSETLTVSPSSAVISAGQQIFLKPSVSCLWSSSDSGVATVRGGYVTGVAAGACIITAKTADGQQRFSVSITVQ